MPDYKGPDRRQELNGEARRIAREAGAEGARECMTLMGCDIEQPLEMQADFLHLRQHRVGSETAKKTIRRTGLVVVVTGGLGVIGKALWEYLKHN